MSIIDAIKNVYSNMEDNWYTALDVIDKKIPVYKVIDKVDAVVPSFALFLVLIFVIIILLIIILLSSVVTTPSVEAIVIVTSGGMPVAGAEVMLASGCNGSDIISVSENTDNSGEAIIEICADIDGEYQISVSKNNFNPVSKSVEIGEDGTIKINLDSAAQLARAVYAEISDEDGNPIEGLSVELVCISDLRTEEITPNEEGKYIFDIFEDCTTIQLRASAQGYETETENIGRDTERVEIIMQKVEENGSAIFEVVDSEGPIIGVEITLIDDVGKSHVLFTDNDGFAEFKELSPGRYNYTALDSETGRSKQNIIEVNPKETVEVSIEFAPTTPQEVDARKKIYVKVVDDSNSPIAYASSVIFKDGNVLTQTKSTDSAGEIQLVVPDENSAYQISINRLGYQLTIVNIVLKSGDESPQIIILKQGGGKINVSVVNEDFEAISGSQLQLYLEGFSGYILSSTTDTNGQVTWENLPAGNYEILALKADSDGSATLTLEEEETKDVEIQMIIGRGEISFRLNDHESTAVDATNITVYAKRDGAYNIVKEGDSSRSYFETEEEKHGTKVLMTIDDGTYFPYESLVYTIYKGNSAEKKYIYLRETDSLPNENKVQMFLQQVYSTSPLQSGTAAKATTLEPGERYYLLFNIILNPEQEETNDLIANFYVGPKDENVLIEHNPFAIQGVESVKDSVTIMSSVLGELQINYLDEDIIVDEDAKQANLLVDELSGPKQIPILVILDVDLNAEVESTSEIFFNAKWGDITSLDYEKEFEIGKTFCMGSDCPVFLFSNYIKWDTAGGSYEAITTENTPKLYLGDEYTLKTIIENLSDEDFKDVKLQTVQTSTEPKILFDGNASAEHDLVLSPLSQAAPIEMDIEPVDNSTSIKIKQQITKYAGATDLLEGYVGTENESRVKVYTKDQVKIQTALTTIYAGAEYPMFTLKVTNDSKKEQLQANWKVNKEGETALFNSMAGTTDVNGLDVIQLDASALEDGDVLIFTAYSSGMLDGTTRVEVENRLPTVEPPVLECLSVEQEQLSVYVGSAVSFTIDSDCDVEREVYIYTDQFVSDKQFYVPAKGSVSVSVTGTARDGILGVYPLQILSIDEGRYSQVGFIDIIVSQSGSCFSIDSVPIYDFQTSETAAGRITNNCFSGRKDIYYPQISFSTNSVSVSYQKDGVPETITLYPTVYGSAIESIIYGQIKADAVHILETCGDDSDPYQYRLMPTELYFMEDVAEACEDFYDEGESTPKPEPEETEDLSEDPYNEYVESETVAEEGSSSTIIEDEEENGEFATSEKVDKISFSTTGSEVSPPADVVTGDYGEIGLGSMPEAFSDICVGGDQCENQTMVDDEGNPIVDADGEPITGYSCADGIFSCSASEVNDMWGCCTAGQSRWGYHGSGYFMEYYYHFLKDLFGNQGLGAGRPPEWSASDMGLEEGEDPEFTWTSEQGQWKSAGEIGENNFKVISAEGHKTSIEELSYLGDGEFYAKFQVKGSNYYQWGRRCRTAQLKVQMEMGRVLEFVKEQRGTWTGEENISPIEGKVYDLGSYADAYPSPLWTNEETMHGKEVGDEWNLDGTYLRYGIACVHPNGFVNPEEHGAGQWEIRDASDPLVEYDGSGNIMYWIPSDTIPEGVEMYLKYGHVWAKYNGVPEVNSPNIDLTFTKANLIGNEYAIITVKDWMKKSTE